jgi:hypothetical protein
MYAGTQTNRALRKKKRNCILVVRTANRLMTDQCYLRNAMQKSVGFTLHTIEKQRASYRPVPNKEAQNKGQIHSPFLRSL